MVSCGSVALSLRGLNDHLVEVIPCSPDPEVHQMGQLHWRWLLLGRRWEEHALVSTRFYVAVTNGSNGFLPLYFAL